MAIKWVKDNIAGFGGDPNSITLMGESAGSASVTYQLLTPHSSGLFQRVIGQSGAPTTAWANVLDPAKAATRLARAVNCSSDPTDYDR